MEFGDNLASREHRVAAAEIADLYVGIPAVILGRLTIPRPVDVQAAQMSLPHSVALAAVLAPEAGDGFALSVRDFEKSISDSAVKEVERHVRCEVDPEVEKATTAESVPARVVIKLKSGETFTTFVPAPKGSPSRPFTRADHAARFRRELEHRWPAERCDAIVEMSRNLLGIRDMRELVGLITS